MSIWTLGCVLISLVGDGVSSEFIPSGATAKQGGYRPIRVVLDKEETIAKKSPEGLEAPVYGILELGDKTWGVILDEPEEGEAKLFVDSDADGDFTNDEAAVWTPKKQGDFTMHNGESKLVLDKDRVGKIMLYRFDPNDPARKALKDSIFFYADFGSEFTITIDGEEFKSSVAGALSPKASFWLDRNRDKRQSNRFEMAKMDTPFNFTGTTFVLSLKEGELALDKASEELPLQPLPPNLALGQKALSFTAKTMEGNEVEFPKSFAGKIVMLDFWATWCGPCIGEIPHMKEAYADWHEKGFEILGVSFDQEGQEEKVTAFLQDKELPWPQIYEGKFWDVSIGIQHDVSGIPFVLLVDCDSGEILGTSKELRGAGLSEFVGKALEAKNGSKN